MLFVLCHTLITFQDRLTVVRFVTYFPISMDCIIFYEIFENNPRDIYYTHLVAWMANTHDHRRAQSFLLPE